MLLNNAQTQLSNTNLFSSKLPIILLPQYWHFSVLTPLLNRVTKFSQNSFKFWPQTSICIQHFWSMCAVRNDISSCYHQVETTIECKRQKRTIIFELSENQLSEIFTISFTKDYVAIIKLEALRQCVPPPRHVLPVLPSGESVWMNVC